MLAHAWDASRAGAAGLEPAEGRGRPDRAPRRLARAGHARVGAGATRPARACASASSTRASRRAIRSSASSRARSSISIGEDDEVVAEEDTEGDLSGHGTACAGIVRATRARAAASRACACSGRASRAAGAVLLGGLRYAVEQGFDVINMSLSTTKKPFAGVLHELADSAYFRARCSSRRRTTCRSRATRGASRR